MERLLIVNADDLGRTPGINRGIFEAHSKGLVTSATMMVAYPAAREAAAALGRHPDLGVGLHVALTGGPSLLTSSEIPSLLDGKGLLPRRPENLDGARGEEVLAEVRAQLDRFRELTGRQPTHLDTHHHSQRLPVVFEALGTVAREERLPIRRASPGGPNDFEGLVTPDAFVETFYDEEVTLETLLRLLDGLRPGSTEIMCHPAYADQELRQSSTYADVRERELEILTDPRVRRRVEELGLHLATFGELV